MKTLYECHITLPTPTQDIETKLDQLCAQYKFKTSKIAGDPVLGKNTYFYLTGHDSRLARMRQRMFLLSEEARKVHQVLRCKIEKIVFDERYDK